MDIDDFEPGPACEATRRDDNGLASLTMAREFQHPPAKLWSALTLTELLEKWTPYTTSRNLDATGPFVLTMIDGSNLPPMDCEVRRVEAGKLLEHTWGDHLVLWQLEPATQGARLTLTHIPDTPDDMDLIAAGWHVCMDMAARLLAGHATQSISRDAAVEAVNRVRPFYAKLNEPQG